ncbi:MAG: hypothetical protein Q7R93_01480 [bacterium]|nr:hypothetical protein [bacterium]
MKTLLLLGVLFITACAEIVSAALPPTYDDSGVTRIGPAPEPGAANPVTSPPVTNSPPVTPSVTNVSPTGLALANLQTYLTKPVPTNVVVGESITVDWKNPPFPFEMSYFDWVGLYKVGARDSEYIERKFVFSVQQKVTFTPPPLGTYEIRYIRWDGVRVATLGPITVVTQVPFALKMERTGKLVGQVTWPTKVGKTYVLYTSQNLRDWEPMKVEVGTGNEVKFPIPLVGGAAFFRVLQP